MIKQLALAGAIALAPTFAEAKVSCTMKGKEYLQRLEDRWGEKVVGEPLPINDQAVALTTANTLTGNWSIVSVGVDGSACSWLSGVGYGGVDPSKALTAPMPKPSGL